MLYLELGAMVTLTRGKYCIVQAVVILLIMLFVGLRLRTRLLLFPVDGAIRKEGKPEAFTHKLNNAQFKP